MKTKLYLLYGGKSVEHDVSLKTALTVIQSVDDHKFDVFPIYITREGIWCSPGKLERSSLAVQDLVVEPATKQTAAAIGKILTELLALEGRKVVLPLLHGSNGEDGTVQGLLELLDVPYVGNGVLASAITLDKAVSKQLLSQAGIAQVEYRAYRYDQWMENRQNVIGSAEEAIGYPCYVKPASLGSSIGISRCENQQQLITGIVEAYHFDIKIVIEKEVIGREIQIAVMGNEKPLASLPGEFIHDHAFFDFESKYMNKQLTMAIPAQISEAAARQIRQTAIHAYQASSCSGLARVDFFITDDGQYYLNEINALPGFTNFSMYPVMWEKTDGTRYSELIEKLIDYAFTRHFEKQSILYTR